MLKFSKTQRMNFEQNNEIIELFDIMFNSLRLLFLLKVMFDWGYLKHSMKRALKPIENKNT